MTTISINSMWTSFESSIPPIESMIVGFAYLLGIFFFIHSITQFHDLADRQTKHSVKGGFFEPIAYLLCGSIFVFIPTWLKGFQQTIFGTNSPLAYASLILNNIPASQSLSNYAVADMLKLAGILFFVRGVALMALSSAPGVGHGKRGFFYMIAGIFSVNFLATFEMIQSTAKEFVSTSHTLYPIHQSAQSLFSQ